MTIVRGLRTFARDGRSDPFEKVPVRTIIDDTLALCRERFTVQGIQIQICGVERELTIECRRVQIAQVLLNLLNNSFDAIHDLPRPWVKICVSEEAETVAIAITDSGPGIPKEIADKAMQPFFTTKPIGKGTGLGLSVSNAIALSHHGSLRIVFSEPGSHVVLSLPKHQPDISGGENALA
jgi:C4-dicarboxylate-specific signal transduction histidine kinase